MYHHGWLDCLLNSLSEHGDRCLAEHTAGMNSGCTVHAYSMSVWELVLEWGHLQRPPKLHVPIALALLS